MNDMVRYIEQRCEAVTESGCWLWLNFTDRFGYGRITVRVGPSKRVKHYSAHRYSYEAYNSTSLLPGAVVRHKCDTPACVNPDHLVIGTQLDNMRDAIARGRSFMSSKTHCIRGHELSGRNIHVVGKERICRACSVIRSTAYRRRQVSKRLAAELGELDGLGYTNNAPHPVAPDSEDDGRADA